MVLSSMLPIVIFQCKGIQTIHKVFLQPMHLCALYNFSSPSFYSFFLPKHLTMFYVFHNFCPMLGYQTKSIFQCKSSKVSGNLCVCIGSQNSYFSFICDIIFGTPMSLKENISKFIFFENG